MPQAPIIAGGSVCVQLLRVSTDDVAYFRLQVSRVRKTNMDPQELIRQAEQKASSSSGFFSRIIGSSSFQLEDAADLYIQAANAFRLRKDGLSAGKAFEKAASLQSQTDAKEEVANTLIEAYKAFRTASPQDAARVLAESVHLFTLRGQFRRAAQYEMDLGELYENELDDQEKAIHAYENAGDWYFNDRAEALSNKAFLKVAELSALAGKYDLAVENFERVAKQSLNSNLSKWSLKDYFIRAILTSLAQGDTVAASLNLDKYIDWDPTFAATKEHEYAKEFITALKDNDEQTFTDKLWEYDQFAKLDKWKVAMGLKIKQGIDAVEGDEIL